MIIQVTTCHSKLKNTETTEEHHLSLQKNTTRKASLLEEQGCSKCMFTAQRVQDTVECTECQTPRCICSEMVLFSFEREHLAQAKQEFEYSCGSSLVPRDHQLHGIVWHNCVQIHLNSITMLPSINILHCAAKDAHRPQELLEKFLYCPTHL